VWQQNQLEMKIVELVWIGEMNIRAYFKGFQVVRHIGGEKNWGAVGAEEVDSGQADMSEFFSEFFAYKHASQGYCKHRRREVAIAESKKPLPTRGLGEAL